MVGRRRLGVALAVLVTACGSPAVTPSPATPAPTRDLRRDVVEQARAVWEVKRPGTVAYSVADHPAGLAGASVRVTEMDGRVEALVLSAGSGVDLGDGTSLAIDALYDRALAALSGDGEVTFEMDQLDGHPTRLAVERGTADASETVEVTEFVTPADRTSAGRAREALEQVLDRWDGLRSPAWAYTWTRFTARDTEATAATWRVHHEDGRTTLATAEGGPGSEPPPDLATIRGTVEAAIAALASGGWVDVATAGTGFDLLIAVDPSPSAAGDGYWIRIVHTDLAAARAREALDAATERWAATSPRRYAYAWRWEGAGEAWGWNVTMNRDVARLRPTKGAPPVEGSFVAPRIEDTFALIEGILQGGGTVDARYDRELGFPTRIEVIAGGDLAPSGVITITGFRAR